ncbi:MAG: hypothetical protein QOG80_1202 [Pseudonocardiales bacterium]|jgi:hypothetical protein|nr:hypothetical protein [Pseudonocardiales bacterium]
MDDARAPGAGPDPADPSALAADALRLIGSAQEWARRTFAEVDPDGHTGPECQWCPLCQFVAVLRGERPEVTERITEAGAAFATALRSALDAAANAAPSGQHRAERAERADPPGPRVQRIDLGHDDPAGEAGPD